MLDASPVVRLISHDPVAESWAAQLGQASMVLAPEHMLADARDLVDQFEPDRALYAKSAYNELVHETPRWLCLNLSPWRLKSDPWYG